MGNQVKAQFIRRGPRHLFTEISGDHSQCLADNGDEQKERSRPQQIVKRAIAERCIDKIAHNLWVEQA